MPADQYDRYRGTRKQNQLRSKIGTNCSSPDIHTFNKDQPKAVMNWTNKDIANWIEKAFVSNQSTEFAGLRNKFNDDMNINSAEASFQVCVIFLF